VHRLTQPASPTTTGKVERFHLSLRRELLDDTVFADLAAAQAAVDAWVAEYNTTRPHQGLDMAFPADRFTAATGQQLIPLKLPVGFTDHTAPPTPLSTAAGPQADTVAPAHILGQVRPVDTADRPAALTPGAPVEFERVVPPSGNLWVARRQFWLGPARAGVTVTFWADPDVIHLLIAGTRIKTLRSHLSVTDLAALYRDGARPAGPPPLPPPETTEAVEVERTVNRCGSVSLAGHVLVAADILGGRRVAIRIHGQTLTFFDPDTRELLRTRPNPLTPAEVARLHGARPAGPAPQPADEPVRVQRRVSAEGRLMVAWQHISLGRIHAGKTVSIAVSQTHLEVDCHDGVRTFRRTNTKPVTRIKVHRPRKVGP
jgi:Integrase core domain